MFAVAVAAFVLKGAAVASTQDFQLFLKTSYILEIALVLSERKARTSPMNNPPP